VTWPAAAAVTTSAVPVSALTALQAVRDRGHVQAGHRVRSLGADHVIDYTRDDIAAGGRRYDAILDLGGNRPLRHLRAVLNPHGTLVIVGGETGGRWLAGSDRQLRALLLSPFTGQRLTTLICSENTLDLLALTSLIESGQVRLVIDRTYPLRKTPAAIQYMRDGHAQGKVVISL
jgi:NADPH:quinone reductase-like Zn-dependent oxidoreductase